MCLTWFKSRKIWVERDHLANRKWSSGQTDMGGSKMRDPEVTMGFKTKMDKNCLMTWMIYHHFRKAPYGNSHIQKKLRRVDLWTVLTWSCVKTFNTKPRHDNPTLQGWCPWHDNRPPSVTQYLLSQSFDDLSSWHKAGVAKLRQSLPQLHTIPPPGFGSLRASSG